MPHPRSPNKNLSRTHVNTDFATREPQPKSHILNTTRAEHTPKLPRDQPALQNPPNTDAHNIKILLNSTAISQPSPAPATTAGCTPPRKPCPGLGRQGQNAEKLLPPSDESALPARRHTRPPPQIRRPSWAPAQATGPLCTRKPLRATRCDNSTAADHRRTYCLPQR